ncbi:hypothetical protein SAMN02745116_01938 [Pilibacter termitis]|uniref:Uncharacterized protein n=1 Tax=Pilibacter termitis TaxID=263852 RepID=A0A1T4PWZ7_9ENTE|nr:hypothetical protein [Pilibacter termitis]SJZ95468.1 hypothetical protein SAMN02745116_01938 [Pilibacter termitis]
MFYLYLGLFCFIVADVILARKAKEIEFLDKGIVVITLLFFLYLFIVFFPKTLNFQFIIILFGLWLVFYKIGHLLYKYKKK